MLLQSVIFYAFAALLILSSILVVLARQPVHSVLFLVLAFFAAAGLWILLEAEFLALILVLVYVGAVMTLFLFVVMMLNLDKIPKRSGHWGYVITSVIFTLAILAALILADGPRQFGLSLVPLPAIKPTAFSNTAALGSVLYTKYFLPFQVAGLLLLAAIISAIMLTLRPPRSKKQNIHDQVDIDVKQEIHLVSMKSERLE